LCKNLQSCHAQQQILKIIMEKKLYDKALEKAGDEMYDLEAYLGK